MTLWPDLNARRERAAPNPEEQPVMNQTGGVEEDIGLNLNWKF